MKPLMVSSGALRAFDALESHAELKNHGPLDAMEAVPPHQHAEPALYLVRTGRAVLLNEQGAVATLGTSQELNAVVVPAGETHGWIAMLAGTVIRHVFGQSNIDAVLAAT